MDTFLSINGADLSHLSSDEAVIFFHKLLCAEAITLGIGLNQVNVPYKITVSDGGIDAEVRDAQITGGHGIIKGGLTRYQIKTGDFSLSSDSNVKEILFSETKHEFKPRIKSCLDTNGTLVVVLFGSDNPEQQDNQVVNKFIEVLKAKDEKYKYAKIEIWRQNQLISFLEPFPSLRLSLLRRGDMPFYDHTGWSRLAEMRTPFYKGPEQEKYISDLKAELQKNNQPVHIRVIGEPGLGKTRLILEATALEEFSPLVVYCESPKQILESPLLTHMQRQDNTFHTILVVDECDADNRATLWGKLESVSPRIKLITIYNEADATTGKTTYLNPPLLADEQIEEIIAGYGFPRDQVKRWVEYCNGSPRAAHIIGQNLKENSEDLTKNPDTVNVWDRYIAGRDNFGSDVFRNRKKVLLWLSLFKKFGYAVPLQEEAKLIGSKIQKEEGILWRQLQVIIDDLRRRKILQGNATLYITPKLLHIKLWAEWWQMYGNAEEFKLEEFTVIDSTSNPSKQLNDTMVGWFCDMFRYARESQAASRVVTELLGENGPFQNSDLLKRKLGASFFLALTEANPEASLKCLQKTVGIWSKMELLEFQTGRREVIWALERIAIWKNNFKDAARLLLKLGEAENERYSNNASGVFAGLFTSGYGDVATTELPAIDRLPVLFEALDSNSKEKRMLGIKAADAALETQSFTRFVGAEFQGLRKKPELWKPKTYGEIFNYYREVWIYLIKKTDSLEKNERDEIIKVLLNNFGALIRIKVLYELVINSIDELYKKNYITQKELLKRIIRIFHYAKDLPDEVRVKLEELRAGLTEDSFSSLLRRYAGMNLLEDKYDRNGQPVSDSDKVIEDLADQVIQDNNLIVPELSWLVSNDAENGYIFGYELGKRDKKFVLLPLFINTIKTKECNKSLYFVGGYFKALFEKDQLRWEDALDDFATDKELQGYVPEMTWRSGMSDKAALRILDLAKKSVIVTDHFRAFGLGSVISSLSERVFQKWIKFLLSQNEKTPVFTALDLYHFFYLRNDAKYPLPQRLTLDLLTHEKLFEPSEDKYNNSMEDYHWKEIGEAYVQKYPNATLIIAEKMIKHFGEKGTIFEGYYEQTEAVLNKIAKLKPNETWGIITKYIGPPIDSRAYHITSWLEGGRFSDAGTIGALSFFNPEDVWKWVDEDKEKRAWYIASFSPKIFTNSNESFCWPREILIRYGDNEDVKKTLVSNFMSEGWSGSASLHYQQKRQGLIDIKESETNENVIKWLDGFIELLTKQIEYEKMQEERRGF